MHGPQNVPSKSVDAIYRLIRVNVTSSDAKPQKNWQVSIDIVVEAHTEADIETFIKLFLCDRFCVVSRRWVILVHDDFS